MIRTGEAMDWVQNKTVVRACVRYNDDDEKKCWIDVPT